MSSPLVLLTLDELHRCLRAPWLLVGIIVLSVGGWTAIHIGERDFAEQRNTYAELLQVRLRAQLAIAVTTGRSAEPGLRVVRPPNPGIVLVQGSDRLLPAAWEFMPAGTEALVPFAPASRLLGGSSLDLEVLTRLAGGLLAIGLGLWATLDDRRSRWLEAVQALPVSSRTASLARLFGGMLTLALVVAVWWAAMSLALWSYESRELVGRLWLLAPATLLSLQALYGLAVVFAMTIRTQFVAAVSCMTLWTAVGVWGPTAIAVTAELALPTAPLMRMERERRQQYEDDFDQMRNSVAQHLGARIPANLSPPVQAELAEREFSSVEVEWQSGLATARKGAVELEDAWRISVQNQQRLAQSLAWLSPSTLAREVLAELAGTGRHENEAWLREIDAQTDRLNAALFDNRPLVNLNVPIGRGGAAMMFTRHPPKKFAEMPLFEQTIRSTGSRLASAASGLVGLVVWCLAAILCAHVATVQTLHDSVD